MVIWNGKHLIGTSPKCARRSIISWGEANGFVQLGDADVKKIEEATAIYLVRNPNGRLPKQIQTVTKRFAAAQGKEPMAQWQYTEELLRETLEDDPKDVLGIQDEEPDNTIFKPSGGHQTRAYEGKVSVGKLEV